MTPRQKELLTFIRDYVDQKGIAPSVQEMTDQLGLASKSNAHRILNWLLKYGYVVRRPGMHRAIWPAATVSNGHFDLSAIPTSALRSELAQRGDAR